MTYFEAVEKMQANLNETMQISAAIRDQGPEHYANYMVQLRKYVMSAQQTLNNLEEKIDVGLGALEINTKIL